MEERKGVITKIVSNLGRIPNRGRAYVPRAGRAEELRFGCVQLKVMGGGREAPGPMTTQKLPRGTLGPDPSSDLAAICLGWWLELPAAEERSA